MVMKEDPIVQALKVSSKRKDRLEKVFTNLEVQRRAIMDITMEWKDFEDYFAYLDQSLQQQFQDVITNEEPFESKNKQLQEALDKREEVVCTKKETMLSKVQKQKDFSIVSLFEPFHVASEKLFVTQIMVLHVSNFLEQTLSQ